MLIRRGFHGGPNFDVSCGYDLSKRHDQDMLLKYLSECKPYVLVITLTDDSQTLSRIAGYAAIGQLEADRHFIAELPRNAKALNLPEWQAVFRHKACVKRISVDTCMWTSGASRSKKRLDFVASSDTLLDGIKGFKCDMSGISAAMAAAADAAAAA